VFFNQSREPGPPVRRSRDPAPVLTLRR